MEFLERIRKQPQHIRSHFAFGSALGITALIAVIWSTTLPARFATLGDTIEESGVQTASFQSGLDAMLGTMGEDMGAVLEEEPVIDPEVEAYTIDANTNGMNSLRDWNAEAAGTNAEEDATNDAGSPPSGTAESHVILIGTTPKTAE